MRIDEPVLKFCLLYGLRFKRQKMVLQCLMEGLSNSEIGDMIGKSKDATDRTLITIYQKSNLKGRHVVMSEIYKIAMEMWSGNEIRI